MDELPRLRARIVSLQELRQLLRAMRAMAASHVQEAQAALVGIRNYVSLIEEAIARCATLLPPPDAHAPAAAPDGQVIVACSEHGFAGGFNDALLDRAAELLRPGVTLGVLGRRGAAIARERGLAPGWDLPTATHVTSVLDVARRAADRIAGAAAVRIVFGRYCKGGDYEVEVRQVLPMEPALLAGAARHAPPLHHLPPDTLLLRLADEYLLAEITRSVMESLASENAARLRAMEAGDHNAGTKLDDMVRREHQMRQEAVTAELLDVITGAEAVVGTGA